MTFQQKIETFIKGYDEELPFSGAVFVQGEHTRYEGAFGFANRSEQIEITLQTRFGMASGCKMFTAVAICQLVEKGLLTFDTYLNKCLSISFPHFDPSITVHHLLTHTSGVSDYFDEEVMSDFEELWKTVPMYTIKSPADFLPMFQENAMKFQTGETFSYSNAGYILLGLIVEEVSGKAFPDYVEEHIFRACEMSDSGYFRMDQLPERTALGYIDSEEDNSWKTNIYSVPIVGGPDGGAFTTVLDLEKFWNGLWAGKLLGPDYQEKLLTPYENIEGELYYGYGVRILKKNDEIYKYLSIGYDPGVRMHSSVNVKLKTQTHILANVEQHVVPIVWEVDRLFSE
ncbi:serine hydrolase domain-containing protein [Bacillus sp. FSL W7-1360]